MKISLQVATTICCCCEGFSDKKRHHRCTAKLSPGSYHLKKFQTITFIFLLFCCRINNQTLQSINDQWSLDMCCFSLDSSVKVLVVLQNGQVKSFLCALTDGRGLETDWRGWPTCRRTRSSPRIVASKLSEVLLALKTTYVSSGNLMPHTAREAKGSFCKASTRGAVRGPEIGFTRPIVRRVNRQILSLEKLHTPLNLSPISVHHQICHKISYQMCHRIRSTT